MLSSVYKNRLLLLTFFRHMGYYLFISTISQIGLESLVQKGLKLKSFYLFHRNDQQDVFNVFGSMFVAVLFFGINNCSTVLSIVATERTVLYREKFAGMYSPWAYSFAQVYDLFSISSSSFLINFLEYPLTQHVRY